MEETRITTRAQTQRMNIAVDENAAALGRKEAGNHIRARRFVSLDGRLYLSG
jgi:hypothetical protein